MEEEASPADDESTQNVDDCGQSRFDLATSDVDGHECNYGDNADADEEE
jgi:hypothetical protein